MKYLSTIILFITSIIYTQCASSKKINYELPTAMASHVKIEYTKICDKGQILYNINCANCHNLKKGRKEFIPDFKSEELRGYELRITNAQHESALTDVTITEEELGIIMTFLTYKKKNPENIIWTKR